MGVPVPVTKSNRTPTPGSLVSRTSVMWCLSRRVRSVSSAQPPPPDRRRTGPRRPTRILRTLRGMRLRLDPADEHMHPLEDASNFNESMYFNVYDPQERVGGFLRLGNRANEGYAEMTTCLYLPDGRVAFMYHRPEIADNDAFDAGGMRFEVVEPVRAR